MTTENSGWDLVRFVKTLTYFDVLPGLGWLQRLFDPTALPLPINPQVTAMQDAIAPDDLVLFDFAHMPELNSVWGALDDVVMGGVSQSDIQIRDGIAEFRGNVSTQNSGGFASVRTRNLEPPLNLTGYMGIRLRVQGDGQRYKFLMRHSTGWDSIAYAASFDTIAQSWIDVTLPFAQLIPVFRAKTVAAAPINAGQICSMQLMLSKFEYDGVLNPRFSAGPFSLRVATIVAYR